MKTTMFSERAPVSQRAEQAWFDPPKPPVTMSRPLRYDLEDYKRPPMSHGPTFALVAIGLVMAALGGTYYLFKTPSATSAIVAPPPASNESTPVPVSTTNVTNADVGLASTNVVRRPLDEIPPPPPTGTAPAIPAKAEPVAVAKPPPDAPVAAAPAARMTSSMPPRPSAPQHPVVNTPQFPDLDRAAERAGVTPATSETTTTTSTTVESTPTSEPAPSQVLPEVQLKR